jgi:hypothetical protein
MKATDFEYRHQTLLHLFVVGLAFGMYLLQPDDIVWAIVRHHTVYRAVLERLVFGTGTLMVLTSAVLQTWSRAYRNPNQINATIPQIWDAEHSYVEVPLYFGRILFALGIGMLAPALGTLILLCGEMLLVARLVIRDIASLSLSSPPEDRGLLSRMPRSIFPSLSHPESQPHWVEAVRKEASKWGIGVTMIVFTLTLQDRLAEDLAGASFLLWCMLNIPDFLRSRGTAGNA